MATLADENPGASVTPAHEQMRLQDRVALVTGGGRGIGRAIAVSLAAAGADVALAARSSAELEDVATQVRELGRRSIAVTCDVTVDGGADRLIERVTEELGGLQILVNNAGGAHRLRSVEDIDDATWSLGLMLNLTATHRMMRAAAPQLFARPGSAAVLNVVSIGALRGLERLSYYSAAKAGVVGLTRAAAREWGSRGVRVNCIGPGWIETTLSRGLREDPEFFARSVSEIPLGRWGSPEDVAAAAVFLVSDAARYVTGQTLYIDGGLLA